MAAVPITNTLFPPPPGYYKAYTPAAVERYAALRGEEPAEPAAPGELDELTAALDVPRADWVLEEGQWMLFGQKYTVSAQS
jgi:mediator of RNA polymerase II transcription subunit 7